VDFQNFKLGDYKFPAVQNLRFLGSFLKI